MHREEGYCAGYEWLPTRLALLLMMLALIKSDPSSAQVVSLPKPELITARQGLPQAFVPAIVQDGRGFIWMATRDGLARYDGYTFKVFQPTTDGRPGLSSPGLTHLIMAPDGRIWIRTDQYDLDCFDPIQETFVNFSHQPVYQQTFGHDTLDTYYPDRHNHLWLLFRKRGLVRWTGQTHRFQFFPHQPANPHSLGGDRVKAVMEDGWGHLWVAHNRGLDRFDAQSGQFVHFQHQPGNPQTIPDDDIQQMYRRANGELWLQSWHHLTRWNPQTGHAQVFAVEKPRAGTPNQIATDSRGNDYIKGNDQLLLYNDTLGMRPLTTSDGARRLNALFVDRSDVLWVGTDLEGVYKFNLRAASFTSRPYQHSFHQDLLIDYLNVPAAKVPLWPAGTSSYLFRSAIDHHNRLWFSVGGASIYRLDQGGKAPLTLPFRIAGPNTHVERPIPLATDPEGQLWVVHPDWSGYYQSRTNQWIKFPHPLPALKSAMLQAVVDRQALWIATSTQGLYQVDRQTGRIRHFAHQPRDSTSLSSNNLYWLTDDPLDANLLWVGTFGSGLCRFNKRSGSCQRISTQQGLPNKVIYAAIADRQGSVWVATNQGLAQVDRRTGQALRTYTQEDGLGADEFNRFHALALPDGQIILGTIHGLTAFNPSRILDDTFQPQVQLTTILINNRDLPPGPRTQGQPISQLRELSLPYKENFVTVRFAAMQYNRLGHTQYRYRLTGLNDDWVSTSRPEAVYTDLSPGSYQLHIQAANTAGQWSRHIQSLAITINPPWWRTSLAYLIYLLSGIGALHYYITYRTQREREQQQLVARQREAEQLRAVDEMKTRFFANITHEFRTPITLILTPTEQLKQEIHQPEHQHRLVTIDRNAHQLLTLVNQLLDLSKLEAGALPVDEAQGDLVEFVRTIVDSFESQARAQSIQLRFQPDDTALTYWFDFDKLERIVMNLVSNALKFTPAGGQIAVYLSASEQIVQLTVSDTGIGIAPDQLTHIFERFYQVNDSPTREQEGTGIGLALVKELVDLQGGQIEVKSQPGEGTTFTLQLPYRVAMDSSKPIVIDALAAPLESDNVQESLVVLLVEDNRDLAHFIATSLPAHYTIHQAFDGEEGLQQALETMPDLIISDVLMPVMDGYTLVSKLKADWRTSHIPVILLTAKSALDSRLQGLSLGADDYITKPFHIQELQLRVGNKLDQSRQLRSWWQARLLQPSSEEIGKRPDMPDPFLELVYQTLEQHLDEVRFGPDELVMQLKVSRMGLYRKLKALTDLSTGEFVRSYRLKRATEFLQQGLPSTETAYRVGFDSPAYFTKCFREAYHMTPTEFAAQTKPAA